MSARDSYLSRSDHLNLTTQAASHPGQIKTVTFYRKVLKSSKNEDAKVTGMNSN